MTQEQEEAFKEVSAQIKIILGLMKSVKKLANDVLAAQIHGQLVAELQAKMAFASQLTNDTYGPVRP